jgi:hypothetical protein
MQGDGMNPNEPPKDKFSIGIDAQPPTAIVITIPIKKWAEDRENGAAMLHGKMREAESICASWLVKLRPRAEQFSVIGPNNARK